MDHRTPSSGSLEPAGADTKPAEKTDDDLLIEDLRRIASSTMSRLGPAADRFDELYGVEPFHLFTNAPLVEPRPRVPAHLLAAGALLIFLAATASPLALAGFTKTAAQVTPAAIADEEPYKPFPGLSLDDLVEPASLTPGPSPADAERGEASISPPPRQPARGTKGVRPTERGDDAPGHDLPLSTKLERGPGGEARAPAAAGAVGAAVDHALGLDEALSPAAAEVLPASPSRAEVAAALRGVSGPVARCGLLHAGRVTVDATVHGPTGRVTSVSVSGDDAAEIGACVERAVRGARFPRFADESFTIRGFPYSLD